jgi:hypothetical protein
MGVLGHVQHEGMGHTMEPSRLWLVDHILHDPVSNSQATLMGQGLYAAQTITQAGVWIGKLKNRKWRVWSASPA